MVKNEILESISDAPNFYLQKFRFWELTPSAAKLFCQRRSRKSGLVSGSLPTLLLGF